ncbi:MAG: hypothetical protein LBK73_11175 [Treponema sp.]|nr:hypothetical protein [Treponema sp.]
MYILNNIYKGNSIELIKNIDDNSIDLIASDIPYGIGIDDWDVLHNNTNNAYLGSSPAQEKAGAIFKRRGKPLNGWSEADRLIPKQYYDWVKTWAGDWSRIIKPGANVFVFAGRRFSHRCICAFEDVGFTYKDMIGWEKDCAAHRAKESVLYLKKDKICVPLISGWDGKLEICVLYLNKFIIQLFSQKCQGASAHNSHFSMHHLYSRSIPHKTMR